MRAASPPRLLTLILLTALSTLSLNMFLPSLAGIAADLEAGYGTVSLAVSGYLAVTAVIQLVVGPLSDRVGRRPVLLAALAVFAAASLGCALATDVRVFLGFRMLQGGIIAGYALSLAIVRDTAPEREAAGLLGTIGMAMAVAPMLGPMVGGALDAAFGWRAVFLVYAGAGALLLTLCLVDLGETRPVGGAGAGARREGVGALLRAPRFWALSLCNAFSIGAFYIFLTGVPLVARTEFGMTTAELGVVIGTITGGYALGNLASSRLAPRHAPTTMMLAGRLVACLGLSAGLAATALLPASPWLFFGGTVFVGLGNGLTVPSGAAAAMSVRPGLAGTAAGLTGALVVASGAVLTSVTGAVLAAAPSAATLLILMLGSAGAGLLAVLAAMRPGRRAA